MRDRITLVLIVTLMGLLALSAASVAQEAATDADSSFSATNSDPGAAEQIPVATPIEPDATVKDPRSHAWDRIVVSSDGRSLQIYFWMGILECNGLHSVTVTPTGTGVDVALMTGTPADMAPGTACIEIAQLYVTSIVLEETLIGNAR